MSELNIAANTQAQIDDLRLAAFNFRDESYTDESGTQKRGLTCALHVFVRGDDAQDQKLRVHDGSALSASGKTIEVLEVAATSVRISVK